MRKIVILSFYIMVALGCHAQSNLSLRDSLAKAVDLLGYYPDSIDLRLQKAAWNLQLEQWNYALDEYTTILQRDPANPAALFYRAYVNERMRRYGFARQDYESLLALVPTNFEARLGLALLNQKDRRFSVALDQINRLVEQHPDSAIAYAARAGIEKEQKMLEPAAYDYGEAVRRVPENTDYLLAYADLLITLGRKEEGRRQLEKLVSLGIIRVALEEYYKRLRK